MIYVYSSLALGFLLPLGSIGRAMARDMADDRTARDIERITADLPPERESLLPVDFYETWPQRQTPSDLPARVGMVIAEDRPGRHRAPEPEALTTTDQFWAIVDQIALLEQPCAHCATPEDGEPAHAGCPGCSCPCVLEAVTA